MYHACINGIRVLKLKIEVNKIFMMNYASNQGRIQKFDLGGAEDAVIKSETLGHQY